MAFFVTVAFAMANPSQAVSADPVQKPPAKISKVDRTETYIKNLPAQLKITPAQEELWNKLTQLMRDHANTMDAFTQASVEKEKAIATPLIQDGKTFFVKRNRSKKGRDL